MMIFAALMAAVTTYKTVERIAEYFSSSVTLELPLTSTARAAEGLGIAATGHYTTLEATLPSLPAGTAGLLTWGAALNQVGMLMILTLIFTLAWRLRAGVLFTRRSAWIVASWGTIIALAGIVGEVLQGTALATVAHAIGASGSQDGGIVFAQISFWMPLLGLGLTLIGGVFQHGHRLQVDSEGLV